MSDDKKFRHFLSQAKGAVPTRAQPADDAMINFNDVDYEHFKYAALEKLDFPVSEAFYQWHLKAVDKQLAELRSEAQVDAQEIAELERQKIRHERHGEPIINFNQAFRAFDVADNQHERARLFEEIVGKGKSYRALTNGIGTRQSPLEEEQSKKFDEMWNAMEAFDAREAGKPSDPVEDEKTMQLPEKSARLKEFESCVSDEDHTPHYEHFLHALNLIDDVFYYDDLHAEAIRPCNHVKLDKACRFLEHVLYNPDSPVRIVEGDWQAKDISRRYAQAAQQAREQMLGKSR